MIPVNDRMSILKDAINKTLDVIDQSHLTPGYAGHPERAKSTAFSILLPHVIQAVQDEYDLEAASTHLAAKPQCDFMFLNNHAKVHCQLQQHEGDLHQVFIMAADLVNLGMAVRKG